MPLVLTNKQKNQEYFEGSILPTLITLNPKFYIEVQESGMSAFVLIKEFFGLFCNPVAMFYICWNGKVAITCYSKKYLNKFVAAFPAANVYLKEWD